VEIREFPFITGTISIDYQKCKDCQSYACIKACSLFGRSVLRLEDNKPVPIDPKAIERCIEDLSCELYCQAYGNKGLNITLNMFGLTEYRHKLVLNQQDRNE